MFYLHHIKHIDYFASIRLNDDGARHTVTKWIYKNKNILLIHHYNFIDKYVNFFYNAKRITATNNYYYYYYHFTYG